MENDIENDQELYSYFVQRNATLCEDNFSYLMEHKEVKLLLNDYLSNILLHKPDDVFKFTRDYFRILSDDPQVNKILIVVGPEGCGKSILVKKLIEDFPNKFEFPHLHTTRKNKDGKYYHVEKEEFLNMLNNEEFFEHNYEDDEYEGFNRKEVLRIFKEGRTAILEIGIEIAKTIYYSGIEATFIAVLPPSLDALRERLKSQKKGNTATINQILEISYEEISKIQTCSFFTHKIINDDLEKGYEDFKNSVISSFPFLKSNYAEMLNYTKIKSE